MSLAEEMVDGLICTRCQLPFTKAHGYPVVCRDCGKHETERELKAEGLQLALYPCWSAGENKMSATKEMKAGRELDALVAEKVMGFRRIAVPKDYDGLNDGETLVPSAFDENSGWTWAPKGRYAFEAFTPRYSTDIAAAMEVFPVLRAKGWVYLTIQSLPDIDENAPVEWDDATMRVEWFAELSRYRSPVEVISPYCDTPAEAICLAALEAVFSRSTSRGE